MFTMKALIDFTIHSMLIKLWTTCLVIVTISTQSDTHTCSHIIIMITYEFESKL